MKALVNLIDRDSADAQCVFTAGDQSGVFEQFILVGFESKGETIVTAADVRDLAIGIRLLQKIFRGCMEKLGPDIERDVEIDVLISEALRGDDKYVQRL